MQIGDWITLSGVIVTSGFNYLVWKATKANADAAKASANAAQATYELTKKLTEIQQEKEQGDFEAIKRVQRKRVWEVVNLAYVLLVRLGDPQKTHALKSDDVNFIKHYPKKPELTPEEWAKYFTKDEIEGIERAWKELEHYMAQWFFNDKVIFPEDHVNRVNWASAVIDLFHPIKIALEK